MNKITHHPTPADNHRTLLALLILAKQTYTHSPRYLPDINILFIFNFWHCFRIPGLYTLYYTGSHPHTHKKLSSTCYVATICGHSIGCSFIVRTSLHTELVALRPLSTRFAIARGPFPAYQRTRRPFSAIERPHELSKALAVILYHIWARAL